MGEESRSIDEDAFPARGARSVDAGERTDAHTSGAVDNLKQAMRRARFDNAERSGAIAEFRQSCLGRLEILREALRPLLSQIPKNVDLFDIGLMPSSNPRLFIDMIGFVEMGRDARVYRFMQDTRHTRIKLAESEDVDAIVEAVTGYVAQRLLERDKALASDDLARRSEAKPRQDGPRRTAPTEANRLPPRAVVAAPASQRRPPAAPFRWAGIGFAFLIDLLGSIAFFLILAGIGWVVWNRLHGQIS